MKLVQKMSVGLSLACAVMLTSCSKEDVQTPEPQAVSVNPSSNLKTAALPWIAPTKSYGGFNTFPYLWERVTGGGEGSNTATYPAGTSTSMGLWANKAFPWLEYFPMVPAQPWNSFVTVTSTTDYKWEKADMSQAKTTIKYLKPGYTYVMEFYVTSARPKANASAAYVGNALVTLSAKGTNQFFDTYMLANPQNNWIKRTIEFVANDTEMTFTFGATSSQKGKKAYAHLFIGQNAIWQK
ncbi:hypothetical protein [Dyadobacter luticola]|uniref:DUF642 domain-containing protein n=1 Tax=Dyadobacter luticola TaxID=1979387 RepID=A0A5R9KVT2_9BACT|nr:hypothetical protein [Dyadobacter luticola]TLV00278.1 hypothetical protein FEN17_12300 [Dyadobacter luticola]